MEMEAITFVAVNAGFASPAGIVDAKKKGQPKQQRKRNQCNKKAEPRFFLPKGDYKNRRFLSEDEKMIKYDDFAKLDLRIGEVKKAEKIERTHQLKLEVDVGETRTIVSSIADDYSPEELVGKKVVVVANLEPRKICGVESQGMLLCAMEGKKAVLLMPGGKLLSEARCFRALFSIF